jgi:general secretion pathway protein G
MRLRERREVVRTGFTLMEMLVVVAILVVLAGAAVPIYMNYLENAKKDRAKVDVRTLAEACQAFQAQHGELPASLEVLTQPQADGQLATLETSSLLDPWFRPYQYQAQGQHNAATGKPDIWSQGPRPGDPNSIIGNWGN